MTKTLSPAPAAVLPASLRAKIESKVDAIIAAEQELQRLESSAGKNPHEFHLDVSPISWAIFEEAGVCKRGGPELQSEIMRIRTARTIRRRYPNGIFAAIGRFRVAIEQAFAREQETGASLDDISTNGVERPVIRAQINQLGAKFRELQSQRINAEQRLREAEGDLKLLRSKAPPSLRQLCFQVESRVRRGRCFGERARLEAVITDWRKILAKRADPGFNKGIENNYRFAQDHFPETVSVERGAYDSLTHKVDFDLLHMKLINFEATTLVEMEAELKTLEQSCSEVLKGINDPIDDWCETGILDRELLVRMTVGE